MWDFVALWQTRTDGQCQHRWQKVLNPELVKGPWTKEEDQRVRRAGCSVSSEEDRDGWINGERWWIWAGCDDLIDLSFREWKSLSSASTTKQNQSFCCSILQHTVKKLHEKWHYSKHKKSHSALFCLYKYMIYNYFMILDIHLEVVHKIPFYGSVWLFKCF